MVRQKDKPWDCHDRLAALARRRRVAYDRAAVVATGNATMPLALSDAQLDCVLRAAEPLDVADRDLFLRDVARALDGQELGDGTLARTCREIQRRARPITRTAGSISVE